jgi:drug/metabolite transporter (DMT)-like permease
MTEFRGEIAALSSAFIWAISSTVYTILGKKISPIVLNLSKGAIAIVYILVTLLILKESIPIISTKPLFLLLLSGATGIGFGDTAFFSALNILGARKTLLIQTIAPAITALLGFILLNEQLKITSWCGMLLTIFGIAWVINERTKDKSDFSAFSQNRGIIWAIASAIAQSVGAILSRSALTQSNLSTLWSTILRLVAGIVICSLILLWQNQYLPIDNRKQTLKTKREARTLSLLSLAKKVKVSSQSIIIVAITAFGSTYLGIWLQQISLKFTAAGIAQTLSATSPIFVIPLTVLLGEKISYRTLVGVILAIVGIGLLFYY